MTEEKIKPEKEETEEAKEIKKIEEKPETTEAKKPEEKKAKVETTEKRIEKEFIIPLRRIFKKTASYKRVPKSIRAIKLFLVRHMKLYERDVNKIKIDKYLNEFMWARGIKNPPAKIKIKAFVDGDFIKAELAELTEKLRFKKEKLERREKRAAEVPKKKEVEKQEVSEEAKEEKAEEKKIEKEKQAAVVEAGQKREKATAKQAKHLAKTSKQPKHQRRMALQK